MKVGLFVNKAGLFVNKAGLLHADIVYKNKKFQLTGNQMTEPGYDYLTVYAGTTNKGKKLLETSGCEEEWVDEPDGYSIYHPINIEPVICSSMLLHH